MNVATLTILITSDGSRPRNKGRGGGGALSKIFGHFTVFWRLGPVGLSFGPKIRGGGLPGVPH